VGAAREDDVGTEPLDEEDMVLVEDEERWWEWEWEELPPLPLV
jgi:hypothetical protein